MGAPDGGIQGRRSHIGCGHGRRRCCPAPAKAGAGCDPGRQAPTRRRRDQLWQRRSDRMRVGLPVYVPPGFRTNPPIRTKPQSPGALPDLRPADVSAMAGALFSSLIAKRTLHSAMAELPLIRRSLIEHEALMAEAKVPELLRRTGWPKLFRSDTTLSN